MNAAVRTDAPVEGFRALLEGLRALGPGRLAAMGLVSFGMLCMLALLAFRGAGGGSGRMALLYGDLDLHEAAQMVDLLDKAHIQHELTGNSDQILVPEADIASARLLLAKSSLPSGGSVGDELFDRADGLTSTQFEQDINRTRALEGELVRSIRMIDGVRSARIHLVLPRRDPFATDTQPAQASVLLTMRGAARLDPGAVQAIVSLVSAAVPDLKSQAIAIIDNHGTVLARAAGTGDPSIGEADGAEASRKAMELQLAHRVEEMLEASIGPDRVRAEATVTYDNSRVAETQETYNPDQQVIRSQQTVTDKNRSTEMQQNTSVQNNLPNADAGRPQSGTQDDRQEETSNYEIGKVVRTSSETGPRVKRISLAVLVDGLTVTGRDGKPAWQPRSPKEIADITDLVKSAVGFDAARGDIVTVATMRFTQPFDEFPEPVPEGPFGLPLSGANLMQLGQTGMIAVVALVIALFVFRPMIKRLSVVVPASGELGSATSRALQRAPDGTEENGVLGARDLVTVSDHTAIGHASVGIGGDETYEAVVRHATELVERYPEESLHVLRGWLTEAMP